MPDDLYARALARLDELEKFGFLGHSFPDTAASGRASWKLLRALLAERQARAYSVVASALRSKEKATEHALREFAGGSE